ncbi:MAG TPA: hypothetical protein VFX94_12040 [Burkholderiales bacterium]|nr:hypothetical protein [Burkholderiales bacterium]
MQKLLALALALSLQPAMATAPPVEIDPNTRIQGGADPRGSGAAAGAGTPRDSKMDSDPRIEPPGHNAPRPDRADTDKDKPISERKPQEREDFERSKSQPGR